jgi:polysaccharide chain length determinant protein (PEP-CTERM system associated)
VRVRKYTVREVAGLVVRRRWTLLVPLMLGAALAPVLARYAPERYRSDALIVVVPQQVPNNYVQPTVSESVASRLPAITDQILSRNTLERIIVEMDLYPDERRRWVMEDVVQRMRRDVTTTAVGRQVDSFRISYVSDSPEKARLVTDRLARLYMDQNSADRSNQANMTSEFLDAQLAQAKQRLVEQEQRLEDYRKVNAGQLPSQMQSNLQAIQNLNVQLQAVHDATNRAEERRLLIERQLADARALQVTAPPAPIVATAPDGTPAVNTARQLEQARSRLTLMLQRNTPDHPDVTTLRRVVQELEARQEAEMAAAAAEGTARVVTPQDVSQQRRLSDLEAQLDVVKFQIASYQSDVVRLQERIAGYQTRVDAVPTRESELVELTRDYATMQAAYTDLLMKRENAVIAANLEHRRIGEQFRLVDAASRPERPDNQYQRMAIMSSGALAGLLVGLLLTALSELRDSSFRRPEEVAAALSIPVLASIPLMASRRERRLAALRRRVVDAAGVAIVLVTIMVLAAWRMQVWQGEWPASLTALLSTGTS